MEREPLSLVLVKTGIAVGAVLLLVLPLGTFAGIVAAVCGTVAGCLLPHFLPLHKLRLASGLLAALLVAALGQLIGQGVLGYSLFDSSTTIRISDVAVFGLVSLGVTAAVRLLGRRAQVFTVLELLLVVGVAAHAVVDHRQQRIHQPRAFSDWAWTHGVDPTTLLTFAGVAVIALGALLLLRTRRPAKFLAVLALLGLALLLWPGSFRVRLSATEDGLGLLSNKKSQQGQGSETKGDNQQGDGKGSGKGDAKGGGKGDAKGGGSASGGSASGGKDASNSQLPLPVAIALFHDEVPSSDVLYFRQLVLSRLVGNRLVEDKSEEFDRDIISKFPAGQPVRVESPQNSAYHRRLRTSMFLLADHAQLFGLGHPFEMRPRDNPNPRQFVAAYDVESFFLVPDLTRLIGRPTGAAEWSQKVRDHYLELPRDARYLALSSRIVREVDPRFVSDEVMYAIAIKRYLEKEGFYSLAEKELVGDDPTAKFLFGGMRGYCVHFAHAATFLLRSQGIAARVALGYGAQMRPRGAGSAMLLFSNEAHAWPEMYVKDVGWVTFDIYPEHSDAPPQQLIDRDLEDLFGELARKDKSGGKSANPEVAEWIWLPKAIKRAIGLLLFLLLSAAYLVKGIRRVRGASQRLIYRGVLDRLSDLGMARRAGESRERHAARLFGLAPSFVALTREHLRLSLGQEDPAALPEVAALARATAAELRRNAPFFARLLAFINPIGWWFTR